MTTVLETPTDSTTTTGIGTKVAFDSITTPGAYVCDSTGHLVRITERWNSETLSAWWHWSGDEPLWFTCVSTDPACSIDECRSTAGELGINWTF